jgi:hypothetical protein
VGERSNFGEDTAEYENGTGSSTKGSWEAGVDGAQPGIVMLAQPTVGERYHQEFLRGEAEDVGAVVAIDERVTVPYGSFDRVVVTEDTTPLEPQILEHKFYAPGIGVVLERVLRGGQEVSRLVSYTPPPQRSEVEAAREVLRHLGSRELEQRDPVAARGAERAARPVRDLERALWLPPAAGEVLDRRREAAHAVDEDRAFALDVVGEEHQRRSLRQLDRRDPGAHRVDGEDRPAAEHLGEVLQVPGNVGRRRVEEVEPFERWRGRVTHA